LRRVIKSFLINPNLEEKLRKGEMKKDTRLNVRVSKKSKDEFFRLCKLHGLCPSTIINRWIDRFNGKTKKNKIDFDEIYSASTEQMVEYDEYKHGL
jgi:hypothetical protein